MAIQAAEISAILKEQIKNFGQEADYRPIDEWAARARRLPREDVPQDDLETNRVKKYRMKAGFTTLQQKVKEARPDVMIASVTTSWRPSTSTTSPPSPYMSATSSRVSRPPSYPAAMSLRPRAGR